VYGKNSNDKNPDIKKLLWARNEIIYKSTGSQKTDKAKQVSYH
jgi:hypothetical protein